MASSILTIKGDDPLSPMPALPEPSPTPKEEPSAARIFSVQDRQIHITSEETPLYVLCRKWVQNLPEEHGPPPELVSFDLPKMAQQGSSSQQASDTAEPAPVYQDKYSLEYHDADDAWELMKAHFKLTRKHWKSQLQKRQQRHQQRLAPWIMSTPVNMTPTAPLALPTPDPS